ncbi:MAG: MgtC/SapB family protein [Gammaproteobacteria bacterium]|nr:MAG: MgtC/SapB family protein [Gammaproteobacteria bacterium]
MDKLLLTQDFWMSVVVAVICGALIGLERQYRGKAAGLRTGILISLGTMIFVYLGTHVPGANVDGSRVLGQVVTGIGFIGAGVMFNRNGVVSGVTTASVVWVLAAIGSMVGMGYLLTPIVISLLTVLILSTCSQVEQIVPWLRHGEYKHEAKPETPAKQYSPPAKEPEKKV